MGWNSNFRNEKASILKIRDGMENPFTL
jgi:hypothetical protein